MMDKHYNFKEKEAQIYKKWEDKKYFTPQIDLNKKPFTIVMPPPNANGSLHIGHAMFVTLQDIMVRFHRMKGDSALWIPGADHAGILTQVVFERVLRKQKQSRYDLGREEFVRQCYAFSQDNKNKMYSQIKRLGASLDWSREKFTLDPEVSKQVIDTFVKLFKDKLVYRDDRLINWCPRCMTALSNLEVEYSNENGSIWQITYPLCSKAANTGQTRYLVVATTRPETMFGDTAIAVHPDDRRYKKFIGQLVEVPIVGRKIPVIADTHVDPEFGTGAVKVTPAHDPNDFEMGQRHNLEIIQVIDFRNKMINVPKEFEGKKVLEARKELLSKLRELDLLMKPKKYTHEVGHCERCKTIIQPQVSKQWFIKVKSLANKAIKVVENDKIKVIPKRFKKNYLTWMSNLHDWCISRQLWWGHQIPVYYCGTSGLSELQRKMNPDIVELNKSNKGCGKYFVSDIQPDKCPHCGNTQLIKDPDTFDTWFSSGQWAYTTLGYPNSKDFQYFYPTSVMETGYEIFNIWVAKMIMLSLYVTEKIPFSKVYLHGLVRDAFGEKMSKSKGNVVDPIDILEKYGADALRMALIVGATPGNDISVGEPKIKGYRNFANKLWNIARFIEMNSEGKDIPWFSQELKGLMEQDKSLLSELNILIKSTTQYIEDFKFSLAGEGLYDFVWNRLANKYMEENKDRIKNNDVIALSVLRYVFINSLKLIHPYMPFVTEAIWEEINHKCNSDLIVSSWPK